MVPNEVRRNLTSHMERLERALIPKIANEDSYANGRYPCIPLSAEYFVILCDRSRRLYEHLYESNDWPSFLDVGCGIGAKMSLAMSLRFEVYGIEISKTYIEVADRLHMANYIWHGDAREYDKYREMDIIYFYCPMADTELQLQLEEAVYKGARDGTIMIQCMKMNPDKRKEPHLHIIKGEIFLKSKDLGLVKKARKFLEGE